MEDITENTAEKTAETASESMVEYEFEFELELGEDDLDIEFDGNGDPVGCYTPVEIPDNLDRNLIETFGEEGRRMVNAHREEWNRDGLWHFEMF